MVTATGPLLRTVRYTAATSVPGVARIQASVTASSGAAALASAARSASRPTARYAAEILKRASDARSVSAAQLCQTPRAPTDYDARNPAMYT